MHMVSKPERILTRKIINHTEMHRTICEQNLQKRVASVHLQLRFMFWTHRSCCVSEDFSIKLLWGEISPLAAEDVKVLSRGSPLCVVLET